MIEITNPEIEALIKARLQSGRFKGAEDVILQALQSSTTESPATDTQRGEAIESLKAFGKTHGLSLGGMATRDLRHEARPKDLVELFAPVRGLFEDGELDFSRNRK